LAILLPAVIRNIYASKANTLAYILEPIVKDLRPVAEDTEKAASGVYNWLKSVDVPNKLKDEGFKDEDVEKLTELAFTTPSLDGLLGIAPTKATREAVAKIYRESL
jgi:alcohol dehydrogenase class IV